MRITVYETGGSPIGGTKTRYSFFIVGPVASGKTSVLQHLRYFQTYEEWLDKVPPQMYVSHHNLSEDERALIDKWVINQLDKKNCVMKSSVPGFYFMDRAPLDALVFSESEEERQAKARSLSNRFQADNELGNAQIQFIYASGKALEERNIRRGRLPEQGGDSSYLEKQTKDLLKLYSPNWTYDTSTKSPGEVARELVISALLKDHEETDLKAILKKEADEN